MLKSGRCFNCLKGNHKLKECRSPKTCRRCHQRHHQSICSVLLAEAEPFIPQSNATNSVTSGTNDIINSTASSNTTNTTEFKGGILLQTAKAIACDETSQKQACVHVLFDCGSQRSYVTEGLCSKLDLSPVQSERLHLNTFGDAQHKPKNCKLFKLYLSKLGSTDKTEILAFSFPIICSTLPAVTNPSQYAHLSGLELADCSNSAQDSIDILVGSDFYWDFVGNEIRQAGRGPVAINSKLGWLLSGPLSSIDYHNITSTNLIITYTDGSMASTNDDELIHSLKGFWEIEAVGITDTLAVQSSTDQFLDHKTFTGDRYEVSLPWKEGPLNFSDHYILSLNRLRSLHRSLLKDPLILNEYDRILQEQLSKGIIERVPESQGMSNYPQQICNMIHYLPHHGVVRQDHSTTKLQIVYDGSAKSIKDDCSLNDCLQVGPNFIPKLFNILIKFRSNPIAVTADIEKAFLMVGISSSDRDVLRFLWFEDPMNPHSRIIQLGFTRLVFGLRSSPAVLGAVISHHLKSYKALHLNTKEQIEECLYVDDLITEASTAEQGFELYQRAKRIMKEGGLNLRKWNSNSSSLIRRISKAELAHNTTLSEEEESYSKSCTGLLHSVNKTEYSKLLGVIWDDVQV